MYDELSALLIEQIQDEDDEEATWAGTASQLIFVAEKEGQTERLLAEYPRLFAIYDGQVKLVINLDFSGGRKDDVDMIPPKIPLTEAVYDFPEGSKGHAGGSTSEDSLLKLSGFVEKILREQAATRVEL